MLRSMHIMNRKVVVEAIGVGIRARRRRGTRAVKSLLCLISREPRGIERAILEAWLQRVIHSYPATKQSHKLLSQQRQLTLLICQRPATH